jgi:hypothetical protein
MAAVEGLPRDRVWGLLDDAAYAPGAGGIAHRTGRASSRPSPGPGSAAASPERCLLARTRKRSRLSRATGSAEGPSGEAALTPCVFPPGGILNPGRGSYENH